MTTVPDNILSHPALAGETLYVRRGRSWQRCETHAEGALLRLDAKRSPCASEWRGPTGD